RVVLDTSHVLDERYREARWREAKKEWGELALEPRWKVCVRAAATTLRDPLTDVYMARHFSEETRTSFRTMYDRFASAFDERLLEIDWMDAPTRDAARAKLAAMTPRIGGPQKLDGPLAPIVLGRHGENVLGVDLARTRRGFAAAGGPFDEERWRRSALDTNAFVDNTNNSIVFPAAFLRPPMFDPRATIPVQYGAIGFHLGHEMIHNFDTNGARHDKSGRLANWWTPESWKAFQSKADCIRARFAAEPPIADRRLDADRTLTENIADFGGLKLAFRAYRHAREGAKRVSVAGRYTEDQQFFMSFAQDHCVVFGDVDLMRFIERNAHAPHWLRVNAAAESSTEFQRAFGCKPKGSTCELW
ncbi:MAG: M13 family metallopeptidase, partial [Polyangiaceae bacterium]|nr:M13 family metallopeptidase [Polyangiaceae bacterium]